MWLLVSPDRRAEANHSKSAKLSEARLKSQYDGNMTIPQAFDLALRRHQAGRLAEAEALYRQILAVQPNHADALHLLGVMAQQVGRHDLALELIRKAIVLDPNNPFACCNLGATLAAQGQFDEAVVAYRRALELKPDYPEAHNNLGDALMDRGQPGDAIAACRRALELKPDFPEAHYNLGNALKERGQLGEAIANYRRALELKPGSPETYNNLGIALWDRGQFDEAIAAYRHALDLKPDLTEAHHNLGNALRDQGELDEAIAAYRRALDLKPEHGWVHSNLIYTLNFHPGYDAQAIARECARWEQQHAAPLRASVRPLGNNRDPARRLKVGYVSANFFAQAESYFIVPLFEAQDHRLHEIHAYSDAQRPDPITGRLKDSVDVWRDVRGLSDEQLARQIREDNIDVLIDLNMHMGRNRLPVFARQPAPVQVAWLAYPGGTGLRGIGYRLTDSHMEPSGAKPAWPAEEPVRLADCWCCYHPVVESPEVNELPALSAGGVTFGSLNSFIKINARVLTLWVRMLEAVKGSRLLMLCPEGRTRERVRAFFGAQGIAPERVELAGFVPRWEYLMLYQRIDIGLDPFPYNGITTTCDALWMGVPVVTLPGLMPASRAGLSLLSTVGLAEFAVNSEEDYVQLAVKLAGDVPRLAQLRATLRPRMQSSPLMDAPRFARNVEAAYRSMWQRWCAGQNAARNVD